MSSVRAAGRSTATMSLMRAGRAENTATRFDRKIASLIWWVMNSAVALARARIFISSNCMNSRVCASSAANGSSSSSSSGSTTSARAMLTRWRMPPDSSCG